MTVNLTQIYIWTTLTELGKILKFESGAVYAIINEAHVVVGTYLAGKEGKS